MPSKTDLRENLSIPKLESTSKIEAFQNQTLRPVLKLQNELYCSLFTNYAVRQHADFKILPVEKKHNFIEQSLQKDSVLKNIFIGMTIGMFTLQEMDIYCADSKVYNKRIIAMLIERLKSQINHQE